MSDIQGHLYGAAAARVIAASALRSIPPGEHRAAPQSTRLLTPPTAHPDPWAFDPDRTTRRYATSVPPGAHR